MLDLFGGASTSQVNEVAKALYTQHITLVSLLMTKGVISEGELKAIQPAVLSYVDQEWEKAVRQKNKELLEENPGSALLAKLLGEEIPLPVEDEAKR